MKSGRVASSQVREAQEVGGGEGERRMDGDGKEDGNSDW